MRKTNEGADDGKQKSNNPTGTIPTEKEIFTKESYERLREGAKKGGENSHGNSSHDTDDQIAAGNYPTMKVQEGVQTEKETFTKESYERLLEGARKGGKNSHKS